MPINLGPMPEPHFPLWQLMEYFDLFCSVCPLWVLRESFNGFNLIVASPLKPSPTCASQALSQGFYLPTSKL